MPSTEEKLAELVKKLQAAAGANLESVILYGSAARGDYRHEHSDLNVLCIVRSLAVDELSGLAPVVHWWSKEQKEPAPLFFTSAELRDSAGVFSIELLDMQKHHRVLFGADVISGIPVPRNLHRIQVERDFRTLVLRLRQHYLHASAEPAELARALAKSFSSVLTLLRHTLIALDQDPPAAVEEIFGRIAVLTGADAGAFQAVRDLRESGRIHGNLNKMFGAFLSAVEKVTRALDERLPKRDWRRGADSR